jgi:long-subunit acyl-CoA synthetase (AMP-forming)
MSTPNLVTLEDTTLTEQFVKVLAERGDQLAIRTLDDAIRWTWNDLDDRARRAATALRGLGVHPGDTVGLLLSNRPEFYVLDLAAVMLGATPVSVYATSSPEQVAYVAGDGGFRLMLCDAALQDAAAQVECPVLVVEAELQTLLQAEPLGELHPSDPSDLLTIIYTSGTTGPPKGVELRHSDLMFAMSAIGRQHGLNAGERVICWLPMAHIAERLASYYSAIIFGSEVTTCPDARQIASYLKAVHPTWFFAVPRIWEKLKTGIEAQVAALPDEQRAFVQTTLTRSIEKVNVTQAGGTAPAELEAAVAEPAAVEALHGILAGVGLDQAHTASVGAAPIAPTVITFFHALGVPLAEIYGQSEGCACATCNPRDKIKIGTVGVPQPGVELRLADDGEILIRGRNLMRGYRNQPEATAEAIDADGWLHSGDIGELDDEGYLKIVDRKKELIISAAGKNMSPSNIEATIKTHTPLIGQIVAIGDRRPYNVALIVLDPDALNGRAADAPEVLTEIERAVERGNERLARVEQIKRFHVLDQPWGPGGDELTPTMKLKRKPITEKYAAEIQALYG